MYFGNLRGASVSLNLIGSGTVSIYTDRTVELKCLSSVSHSPNENMLFHFLQFICLERIAKTGRAGLSYHCGGAERYRPTFRLGSIGIYSSLRHTTVLPRPWFRSKSSNAPRKSANGKTLSTRAGIAPLSKNCTTSATFSSCLSGLSLAQ